jgi:hypothetical protein
MLIVSKINGGVFAPLFLFE